MQSEARVSKPNPLQLRKRLAAWLRWYIRDTGLSQAEVARLMGVKEATITNLVKEKRWAGIDTFVKMRLDLGLSLERMVLSDPETTTSAQPVAPTKARAKKLA